jgi:hypothetical protein
MEGQRRPLALNGDGAFCGILLAGQIIETADGVRRPELRPSDLCSAVISGSSQGHHLLQ